ncbi:MAG: MFS family permease [Pseudohongiellaceae bacterium]|jgi:MFS family permease
MPAAKGEELYYGWKVAFALLGILTFTSGLSFYNHSIYLNALATNPAFDIRTASYAVSIFFLSGGFAGLMVAKLIQDYDPRLPICLGAIIAGLALCLFPRIVSVWQLYCTYALFGVGFAGSGLIPATTLVTRWFQKRRAVALSVASTGLSLGGVVITPISVLLVSSLGFDLAAPLLGLIYVVGVVPAALIFLRPSPASMGLRVDGGPAEDLSNADVSKTSLNASKDDGVSFKSARQGRFFWGIACAYVFLMMAQVGGISHQYGLVKEQLTDAETAFAVAIIPVASIVGRFLGGWLVGQIPIRLFAITMMAVQALSLGILALGFSEYSLYLGLALFGASVGNLLMLQPLLIADAFGLKDYAKIFSICNLLSSWGTAIGPAMLGFAYTINGDLYSLPYWLASGAGALGLFLFLCGGKWKREH